MIIALPRSGTTWAANWLNTGDSYCVHDPLWTTHYSYLDRAVTERAAGRAAGISCTGLWRWPAWVNGHPARKLVLHRPVAAIDRSLGALGLPALPREASGLLASIAGRHADYTELFDPTKAEVLWDYLTGGLPFNPVRHAELRQLRIEPQFAHIAADPAVTRALRAELSRGQ